MTEPPPTADAVIEHPDVEIIAVEIGFQRYLRLDVFRFRHRLFSGGWSGERTYDVLRRGRAVMVLLYDPDRDAVVFVEQFRLPALVGGSSPWQIEAVGGLVERGEADDAVARRETREEAALDIIDLLPIHRYLPTAGGADESVMLFCGRVDSTRAGGVHGLAAEHEDIRTVVKTLPEAVAMLDSGTIENGHTLICLYWLLRHRERVRHLWGPISEDGATTRPAS